MKGAPPSRPAEPAPGSHAGGTDGADALDGARRALGRTLIDRDGDIVHFCQRKYLSEIYLITGEPIAHREVAAEPMWAVISLATRAIARWLETGASPDAAVRSEIASLGDLAARQRSRIATAAPSASLALHRRLAQPVAGGSTGPSGGDSDDGSPATSVRFGLSVAMLTKLNFWWCEGTWAVLAQEGARLGTPASLVAEARDMVMRTSHTSLVDMATRFDAELESMHRRLAELALEDALTGLANRTVLTDHLDRALARQARSGATLVLMFVDVDDFKVVNDVYGHAVGDAVLVEIAARLESNVRPGDVAARLGGDEFLLLLENLTTSRTEVERRAEHLRAVIANPISVQEEQLRVTASVGAALVTLPGHRSDEVLARADGAMYIAKRAGRDRVAVVELDEEPQPIHFATASGMHRALEHQEFCLDYQAVYDSRSGAAAGFEALLRWEHPEHGTIAPLDFVPLAEKSGLMVPIGDWVLEEACRQAVAWTQPGGRTPRMAVNVSVRQLDDREFPRRVARVLDRTAMPPDRLTLEITETILLAEDAAHEEALNELKGLGVQLSIDDFGTGYSSLAYLRRLPVDQLKVDRSFIEDVAAHGDTRIMHAVVRLAHDLGLEVVAEGVETLDELDVVRRLGCDVIQGYLLASPVSAAKIDLSDVDPPRCFPDSQRCGDGPRSAD